MKRSIVSYFISTKKEKLSEATNTPTPFANSDVTDDVTTTGTSDTESIEVPELSYENYTPGLVEDQGSNSDSFVTGKISTPTQNEVRMGCHQNAVSFVTNPFYNLKKAVESFKQHQSTTYHKNTVLAKADVIAVVEKRKENIDMQLDHMETIRLCGLQNIPLRGHADCGPISLSIPVDNDGNFRSLLRYRANGGGQALQDHIENSSRNAMYTSPRIQKEIIDCFGQLIQKKIVERVEQFSLCVRYIYDYEEHYTVREDVLSFVPVYDVTGEALAEVIEKHCCLQFGSGSHKRARTISPLHFVISVCCKVPFEKIRNVFDFYKEDLKDTNEDAFKGEWDLWKQKWNEIEEKPTSAIDSLAKCDRHLFTNVYILLKILAMLPVSTTSVERSV
ncbi:hypothetical protein PR048_012431 [Dryococelus australis]|uniref:DUF4371 domain-containing protein n=1 Tax=Dryococelus australis TaxID=614101 RepID=A0ABQ9HPS1_9NEOP|nr:hypothetical protein PR048_012431 [Dryococelus australis]